MGRTLGRAIGPHRRGQQEDSGFTLIELMVAILVFFIAIPPITYALVGAFSIAAADKDRVVASDLLSQALDNVRSLPFGDVSTGTTTSTQSVNGTTFTITQTVKPIAPPEQSTDVCGASTNDNAVPTTCSCRCLSHGPRPAPRQLWAEPCWRRRRR